MTGTERARGWVAHLLGGGTTPWAGWSGDAGTEVLPYGVLPGAQQLELLRRLNAYAAQLGTPLPAGLPARVLGASLAGRGLTDLPLSGTGGRWGAPPVDPADLHPAELVRAATTLLAEDLVALGDAEDVPVDDLADPGPRHRWWHRPYRLVGDPGAVVALRERLTARGRPPGGRRPLVLVLAAPLDEMLAHAWAARCFGHGAVGWEEWVRQWPARDALPPRLDLVGAPRDWTTSRRRTRVLVGRVAQERQVPRLLGLRRLTPYAAPGGDAAELSRRVAGALRHLVPPERAEHLLGTVLRGRVPATGVPLPSLPAGCGAWADGRAVALVGEVRRSGYPVVGDLDDLRPDLDPPAPSAVAAADVLALAVRMLADASWQHGPRRV